MIGVVEKAWIDGGRGYATVRFSENDLGAQIFRDVVAGIVRNVSFGYRVLQMAPVKDSGDPQTFIANSWSVFELSMVAIPADAGVGVSRADNPNTETEVSIKEISPFFYLIPTLK
jgi:phage head maturation protease